MAIKQIDVEEFLQLAVDFPILDVRSPSEFHHAHIPEAYSFPLFTDDERAAVGTLYKQKSREAAIQRGLDFFGPKLNRYIQEAEQIASESGQLAKKIPPTFLIHCWRGGMRSAGIGWLLDLYGYKVMSLRGGYKAYRHWVLAQFYRDWEIRCLGGFTGSGKTEILAELKSNGEKTIDLEELAIHKGSAFGGIGQAVKQPTQEMFENHLAKALYDHGKYSKTSKDKDKIWIEDESQRIGSVNIPQPLWQQMRSKDLVFLDIPFERRLQHIKMYYGKLDRSLLLAAISRLQKKLGGLETKNAIAYLLDDDIEGCFRILLQYYDKLYLKSLDKKKADLSTKDEFPFEDVSPSVIAVKLIERYGNK